MSVKTPLCKLLGCETPVLLAGMGKFAGADLVAEVSKAGGYGVFGSAIAVANEEPEKLEELIRGIGKQCEGKPFGVDVLVHGAEGGVMKQLIEVFANGGAGCFVSGKGVPRKDVIEMFHSKGMTVASIAGRVDHATRAVELGVDFVVVQGSEGGGHTGEVFTTVLLPQILDAVAGRIPVVAAGGIYDGRGMAAALCYGAQGVWVGSRFLLTPEADAHPIYKEKLLRATSDDTMVTKAFTGATLRALRNPYLEKFEADPKLLEDNSAFVARRAWNDGVWKVHSGDVNDYVDERQAYVIGQNVGALKQLVPAQDVVREMTAVCAATLVRLRSKISSDGGKVRTGLCDLLGVDAPVVVESVASGVVAGNVAKAGALPVVALGVAKDAARACAGRRSPAPGP